MERPGLVRPMDEMLVMDMNPVSEEIVYRVDSGTSSDAEVSKMLKEPRRSNLEAACKMYDKAKEYFVAFVGLRRMNGDVYENTPELYCKHGYHARN